MASVLSYEFLYEPDQVMVHPALDRLAFLIEPDGVRLHWMTVGTNDPSGLPADNVADEPAGRHGLAKPPLKPGEWNAMHVRRDGDRITLSLNGETIYERGLEPGNAGQFGLYHDKERTSVQVRNVELRGRWPEAIPATGAGRPGGLASLRAVGRGRPPCPARDDRRELLQPRGRRGPRQGPRARCPRIGIACSPTGS